MGQGWLALQKAAPQTGSGKQIFPGGRNAFCHPATSQTFAIGPLLSRRVLPKQLRSLLLLQDWGSLNVLLLHVGKGGKIKSGGPVRAQVAS